MLEQPRGAEIDTVVLACTHFPLIAEELALAMPRATFVDGGTGIARRIVWLTREQPWPVTAPDGIAVFTGSRPTPELVKSLARFGLGTIVRL